MTKKYHLNWELIYKDKKVERFKITSIANRGKYMIIENNRPFIREVKGLKKRRIDWKRVEGPKIIDRTLQSIIDQIENPTKQRSIQDLQHTHNNINEDKQFLSCQDVNMIVPYIP